MARIYSLVPLPEGPFEGLDLAARAVFGEIYDRYRLSSYRVTGTAGDSEWYDYDEEEIFCLFSHADLAARVGISERTVRRCLADLERETIIRWRKADYKGCCRYYIHEGIVKYLRSQQSGKI